MHYDEMLAQDLKLGKQENVRLKQFADELDRLTPGLDLTDEESSDYEEVQGNGRRG